MLGVLRGRSFDKRGVPRHHPPPPPTQVDTRLVIRRQSTGSGVPRHHLSQVTGRVRPSSSGSAWNRSSSQHPQAHFEGSHALAPLLLRPLGSPWNQRHQAALASWACLKNRHSGASALKSPWYFSCCSAHSPSLRRTMCWTWWSEGGSDLHLKGEGRGGEGRRRGDGGWGSTLAYNTLGFAPQKVNSLNPSA